MVDGPIRWGVEKDLHSGTTRLSPFKIIWQSLCVNTFEASILSVGPNKPREDTKDPLIFRSGYCPKQCVSLNIISLIQRAQTQLKPN